MHLIAYTHRVGPKLFITVGGNYKTTNKHRGDFRGDCDEFESISEFLRQCRESDHRESIRQFNDCLKADNFTGIKEVVISSHPKLPVEFNSYDKDLAFSFRRRLPDGIRVRVKITQFIFHIGEEFVKKKRSKNTVVKETSA
jgi:hypothetical protein